MKASYIFAEEEVEYNLRCVMSLVKSSVSSVPFAWGNPEFVFWRTPFYNVEVYIAMVLQLLPCKKIFDAT